MIDCNQFYEALSNADLSLYAGVPDSLLKEVCACISERSEGHRPHVITANEGAAIGLAAGSYLATGKPGMVYMQNSGLGNAVNPLLSLADPKVYSIPMLLMIGWRGEPGIKDEPQHIKQGEVTCGLLNTMGIPYDILPDNDKDALKVMNAMLAKAIELGSPTALVVRQNTFAPYHRKISTAPSTDLSLTREHALELILSEVHKDDILVSTTGMTSREIYEIRKKNHQGHDQDFLTVGSMGHCSQIALGIAMSKQDRKVFCIDGDGAVIMHMGSLGITGQYQGGNLIHIVINNGKHDSVGGQPTIGFGIDIPAIAKACGYKEAVQVETADELREQIKRLRGSGIISLIEIRVLPGARKDLGRPTTTPAQNKLGFMKHVIK